MRPLPPSPVDLERDLDLERVRDEAVSGEHAVDVHVVVDADAGVVERVAAAAAPSVDEAMPPTEDARACSSAPPFVAASPEARTGAVVDGRFVLGERLGHGGMSDVYRATRLDGGDDVAVKVMAAPLVGIDDLRARVVRETATLQKLASPNVVRIEGSGVLDDGSPYMVLELLEGRDLRTELSERGPLPVSEAVDLVLQACEGLAIAHAHGVVHRDLKPENLFLAQGAGGAQTLKLIDFGIAKWLERRTMVLKLTQPLVVLGSPEYMAPEQIESADGVDGRADLWSLGVVLYELVRGETPYHGQSLTALLRTILFAERPALADAVADPGAKALDRALDRVLATDPAVRTASVHEFARLLAPLGTDAARASLARLETTPEVRSETVVERRSSFPSLGTSSGARLRRSRRLGRVAAVAVMLLAFAFGRHLAQAGHGAAPAPTAEAPHAAATASWPVVARPVADPSPAPHAPAKAPEAAAAAVPVAAAAAETPAAAPVAEPSRPTTRVARTKAPEATGNAVARPGDVARAAPAPRIDPFADRL